MVGEAERAYCVTRQEQLNGARVMQEKIDDFVKQIREESENTVVSFSIFINCEGYEITVKNRTPEDLKKAGISMCNLKGNFIS